MFTWCIERIDPKKIEEWTYQLEMPLPGRESKPNPNAAQENMDLFLTAMRGA